MTAKLTLGPILFNWTPQEKRDFYFKIADETSIDIVYVGEVICSKRMPVFTPHIHEIIERLQKGGKEVIYSTLSLLMDQNELTELRETVEEEQVLIEANDLACTNLLAGKSHCIGPLVNVYNEYALLSLARKGAIRVAVQPELPKQSIAALSRVDIIPLEVQVFGRLPLAISARCNHARAYKRQKKNCELICNKDPDGMDIYTLDHAPFLVLNGLQTMSFTYRNLICELHELQEMGINYFRLSPHTTDMLTVANLFRNVLDNKLDPNEANDKLNQLMKDVTFSNGFYHNTEGHRLLQMQD